MKTYISLPFEVYQVDDKQQAISASHYAKREIELAGFNRYDRNAYGWCDGKGLTKDDQSLDIEELKAVANATLFRLKKPDSIEFDNFADRFVLLAQDYLAGQLKDDDQNNDSMPREPMEADRPNVGSRHEISDAELWKLFTGEPTPLLNDISPDVVSWAKRVVCFSAKHQKDADLILRLMYLKEIFLSKKCEQTDSALERYVQSGYCLATGDVSRACLADDVLPKMYADGLLNQRQDETFGKVWWYSLTLVGRKKAKGIIDAISPGFAPNSSLLPNAKTFSKNLPSDPIHASAASATSGEVIPTEVLVDSELSVVRPDDEPLPVVLTNTDDIVNGVAKVLGEHVARLPGYNPTVSTAQETPAKRKKGAKGMPLEKRVEDAAIVADWKDAKSNGITKKEFAQERNMTTSAVDAVIDRERKREGRSNPQ